MIDSDAQLVLRSRAGDRDAFAALVQRYERPVIAVACGILRSWDDARDAAQDVFAIAYEKLNRLWRPSRFGPWLLRIARRCALRLLRRRRSHERIADSAAARSVPAPSPFAPAELSMDLLTLIARLPEQERVVLTLRHLDSLDVSTIADVTGRPLGTVTKQLSRAYARLRLWMKDEVEHA